MGKEPGGSVKFSLREIEGIEDQANRRLIEDYAFWLVNYGGESLRSSPREREECR